MKLRHKTPCSECPWRRTHPAGWLGGYEPEAFTQQVHWDGPPLPCHRTIPDGEMARLPDEAFSEPTDHPVSMCAGALIHMRNSCKSAQHPAYGDALEQVEPDRENVFSWPQEFIDYHSDRDGWVKAAIAKAKE